jgi:hypothetical protein
MKNILFAILLLCTFSSCDKIDPPPKQPISGDVIMKLPDSAFLYTYSAGDSAYVTASFNSGSVGDVEANGVKMVASGGGGGAGGSFFSFNINGGGGSGLVYDGHVALPADKRREWNIMGTRQWDKHQSYQYVYPSLSFTDDSPLADSVHIPREVTKGQVLTMSFSGADSVAVTGLLAYQNIIDNKPKIVKGNTITFSAAELAWIYPRDTPVIVHIEAFRASVATDSIAIRSYNISYWRVGVSFK